VLAVAGAMASVLVFGMLFVILSEHSFEQVVVDASWYLRPSTFGMLAVLIATACSPARAARANSQSLTSGPQIA